jgi:invasion protein IalB
MRMPVGQLIFRKRGFSVLVGCLAMAAAATDGRAQQIQQLPQQGQQRPSQPPNQGQRLQPQPLQQGQQQLQPAQQGQQLQPAWTKLCGKVVAEPEGQEQPPQGQLAQDVNPCVTFQELFKRDGTFLVSAGLRRQGSEEAARLVVTVPLGVDLRADPQASVDGGKPAKLAYAHCQPRGCTADGKVTTEFVTAMRGGKEIALAVKGPLGKSISFALPLTGFATASDGQASDAAQYAAARQERVNAIRARRADEINKALQNLDKQQAPATQQ